MPNQSTPTTKVFRTSRTAKAAIYLDEQSAAIIGSKNCFVVADERGVTIKGPISMVADAMNVRKGGLFVGINDFLDMIPSTIVTPIPKQIPFPPVFMVSSVVKDVAFFTALMT